MRYARDQVMRARKQCYDQQYQETLRKAGKQLEPLDRQVAKAQKAYDAIKQQEPQRSRVFNFGYERRRKEWQRWAFSAYQELRQVEREAVSARVEAERIAEKAAQQVAETLVDTHFQPVVTRIAAEEKRIRQLQESYMDRSRSVGWDNWQR